MKLLRGNRAWIVFRKTMREILRDKWMLALTLAFAPFFVFLYWLWFQGGSTSYPIALINQDAGVTLADGTLFNAGEQVGQAIEAITYADGRPLLKVLETSDQAEAEAMLRDRKATAFIQIPPEFSRTIQALKGGDRSVTAAVTFGGDLSNTYYMVGANMALMTVDAYVQTATGQEPLIQYIEVPMGASATRTEFETYVPGTLIFSVILLIFLAAMLVAREIETGALQTADAHAHDLLRPAGRDVRGLAAGRDARQRALIRNRTGARLSQPGTGVGRFRGQRHRRSVGHRPGVDRRQSHPFGLAGVRGGKLPAGIDDVLFRRHVPDAGGHAVHYCRACHRSVRYPPAHARGGGAQQDPDTRSRAEGCDLRTDRPGDPVGNLLHRWDVDLPADAPACGLKGCLRPDRSSAHLWRYN